MDSRFDQLYDILDTRKPEVIVEIGTWNAGNALRMCHEAEAKAYYGFDLWEDGSDEIDQLEYNVKARVTMADADKQLKAYQDKHEGFAYELTKGNTRYSLAGFMEGRGRFIDFALIDGGHSEGTIQNDLNHVLAHMKPNGFLIIDDYYYDVPDSSVGANVALQKFRHPYTVLPCVEGVRGGGLVKMVRVEMKDIPTMEYLEGTATSTWTFAA